MRSLQNPFQRPTTVGKAIAQVVIYLVVVWLSARLTVFLGLPSGMATGIPIATVIIVSWVGRAWRQNPFENASFGLADLWLFALVIFLAVILRAFRDHRAWSYAVVVGLVVVGSAVLLELRRKPIDKDASDARATLADPPVDDVH